MNPQLGNILFLDIETVPQHPQFSDVPAEWQALWEKKAEILLRSRPDETVESIYGRAGIYAEFGKIVCISCGVIFDQHDQKRLALKSFFSEDEREILIGFTDMIKKWSAEGAKFLCAHNGKEFDFPYICRRLIINGIPLPAILNTAGKKPWDITHIDTLDLWKFGDFKNFTSLNLLAHTLGIPTPKDDIDGSMVGDVYWKDHDLKRIAFYCQKDVITVAQVYLRLQNEQLIGSDCIDIKL